jgi:hypothetical protein
MRKIMILSMVLCITLIIGLILLIPAISPKIKYRPGTYLSYGGGKGTTQSEIRLYPATKYRITECTFIAKYYDRNQNLIKQLK